MDLEAARKIGRPTLVKDIPGYDWEGFEQMIGLKLVSVGTDDCVMEIDVERHHMNPYSIIHGGVIYSLADSTAGVAAVAASGGDDVVTVSTAVQFMNPAICSTLRCRAVSFKTGSKIVRVEASVETDKGLEVSRMLFTYFRLGNAKEALQDPNKS